MWANRARTASRSPRPPTPCSPAARRRRAIVVFVDAWTAYGGSQFVDSPGTGRYHSYLCEDVVPFVDARYRTSSRRAPGDPGKVERWLRRHDHPDAAPRPFRRAWRPMPETPSTSAATSPSSQGRPALRDWDGSIGRWWDDFRSRASFTSPTTRPCSCCSGSRRASPLATTARRAAFRPGDGGSGRTSGTVAGVGSGADGARYADALRGLRAHLDRRREQGRVVPRPRGVLRRPSRRGVGVTDVRFELFDATHMGDRLQVPAVDGMAVPAHSLTAHRLIDV